MIKSYSTLKLDYNTARHYSTLHWTSEKRSSDCTQVTILGLVRDPLPKILLEYLSTGRGWAALIRLLAFMTD